MDAWPLSDVDPSVSAHTSLNIIQPSKDAQTVQPALFHMSTIFNVQSKQLNGCDEGIHLLLSFKMLSDGAIYSLIILTLVA